MSWWGLLVNRKLDVSKLDTARNRALDPRRMEDEALGEGNFFEKILSMKFSKSMSEVTVYDEENAESIEKSRMVMVDAFDIKKKHREFERRDGMRKRR